MMLSHIVQPVTKTQTAYVCVVITISREKCLQIDGLLFVYMK